MATPLRCPACQSELDLSSTTCQICLRPVSRQEIVRGLQAHKKHEKSRRRWVLAATTVLAATALLVLRPDLRLRLLTAAAPATFVARVAGTRVKSSLKQYWPDTAPDDEHPVAPQKTIEAATNAAAAADGKSPPAPPPAPATPIPAPAPPSAPLPAEVPKPADEKPMWKIAGFVYTLRDAKAAVGVELTFAATEGGGLKRAKADKNGRYSIALPVLPSANGAGYRVTLSRGGKKLAYLEEAALPYRERTQAQRVDAIDEARQSPLLHAPLSPEAEETVQDFALLP